MLKFSTSAHSSALRTNALVEWLDPKLHCDPIHGSARRSVWTFHLIVVVFYGLALGAEQPSSRGSWMLGKTILPRPDYFDYFQCIMCSNCPQSTGSFFQQFLSICNDLNPSQSLVTTLDSHVRGHPMQMLPRPLLRLSDWRVHPGCCRLRVTKNMLGSSAPPS